MSLRTAYAPGLGLAVLAGFCYSVSPLTAWCAVGLAVLFQWAAFGIAGRERRWLLSVLGTAVALRAIAIGILPFLVDPRLQRYTSYFGDAQYAIQRSIWIRNVALGIPVGSRDYIEAFEPVFGWSGYNYMLAALHLAFGPSPYGVAVVSTVLFLAAAVFLYRLSRATFGPLAALAGLVAVVFMPSVFAWSIAPLKEAIQFFVLAAVVAAAVALAQGRWTARLTAAVVLAAAVTVSGALRNGGTVLAVAGVVFGALLWMSTRRVAIAALFLVLLPCTIAAGARNARVEDAVSRSVRDAAIRHLGHARSPGAYYRLLDDKFYAGDTTEPREGPPFAIDAAQGLRFLIRAVVMYFTQPLPWTLESVKWLGLVPQMVFWYLSLLLALAGAIRGVWRQPLLTSLLVGMIAAGVVVVAPNSGNIGTLIRHRDMIVPFVLVLAGFGGVTVGERLAALPVHSQPDGVVT